MKSESFSNTGVLLLAFGGPDSLNSVEPFLRSVLSGRHPSQEEIERAIAKYRAIGGRSPLLDITLRQAEGVRRELKKTFKGLNVYVGMRHWHPFIKDTLKRIAEDGVERVIAVIMSPYCSEAISYGYKRAVSEAIDGLGKGLEVTFAKSWHNHPLFLDALAERIKEGILCLSSEGGRGGFPIHIIFSAHSLPERLVEKDPYRDELIETIKGVDSIIGPLKWSLAYQSGGGGPLRWLGPDVETVMEDLSRNGRKAILLCPLSFVADHVETLYDIDILYKRKAEALGFHFRRTTSLNDSPDFIGVLSDVVARCLVERAR